jgi:hypothetical protein
MVGKVPDEVRTPLITGRLVVVTELVPVERKA